MDGETSIVRFGHHSRAYLEGLTKFWSFWGSSGPPYSPFCTLKMHTFDPIPLENPKHRSHSSPPNHHVVQAHEHGYHEMKANLDKCSE